MSEENVRLALEAYEAWNRGDFDAVIEHIDPDVDWGFEGASRFPGTDASYRGHEGVREFWRTFIDPWEEFEIEIESAQAVGDDLVVLFVIFHGKVSGGLELDTPFAHLLWIEDQKAIRFRAFDDREAAARVAGLAE